MKAIIQRGYGGPDQVELGDTDDPVAGRGEVLVRVRAAAIDRGTWHLMAGLPLIARPFFGLRRPRQPIVGRDVAGVVEAVGPDVAGIAVGDEVIGTARGSLAELAVVPTARLARKPASLSFTEAATLPISGLTALQAVRDSGRVQPGHRVLVIGASGGVGVFAVQIAAAYGAEVTGVCSAAKTDLVRSLGARDVIDYTRDEIDSLGGEYDVVIDIGGHRPISLLRSVLTARGTLVLVGAEGGGRWLGGMHRQLGAVLVSPFTRQRLTALASREVSRDMVELVEMVDRGELRSAVDRTFPLNDAAKAINHLVAGHVRGKVALTV